jgi:hypothetical protein
MVQMDKSGRIAGGVTPLEISAKVFKGLQPAEYDRIKAPALGFFNVITPQYRLPYYWYLDRAKQEEFDRSIQALHQLDLCARDRLVVVPITMMDVRPRKNDTETKDDRSACGCDRYRLENARQPSS